MWEALHAGEIDLPRARGIVDQTTHLDVDIARVVASEVLVGASKRTTGQLKARLRRLVIETDPHSAHNWYREGVAQHPVIVEANDDGPPTCVPGIYPPRVPTRRCSGSTRSADKRRREQIGVRPIRSAPTSSSMYSMATFQVRLAGGGG